jgi:hypothetical protein
MGQVNLVEKTAPFLKEKEAYCIFLHGASGRRPVAGSLEPFQSDPHWKNLFLFHEYFHGGTGSGVGANYQTGWTGLVAKLLTQSGEAGSSSQRAGKERDVIEARNTAF